MPGSSPGVNLRRYFEVICAALGLLVLSPLFAVIGIAIKLDDGGPVFYSQLRVGKCFRPFRLFKFRTMVPEADRLAPLTLPKDKRITRVGRFLRKFKMDEFPQLVNVLKGDMQLVGARPELERYVEKFRLEYLELLRDRPGITDPASIAYRSEEHATEAQDIEGRYITEILPRKLKLSLEHSQHRTFLSDLGILFRTLGCLLPIRRSNSLPGEACEPPVASGHLEGRASES